MGKRMTGASGTVSASRISQLHGTLRTRLRETLDGLDVVIEERELLEFERWGAQQQGAIEFFLRRPRSAIQSWAAREPGSDMRTPIVPLPVGSTRRKAIPLKWWVAWRERWIARGAKEFAFDSAGWSLFCSTNDQDHLLLLRAEWDKTDPANPPNAGQPHWHVHRVLDMLPFERPFEPDEGIGGSVADEDGLNEEDAIVALHPDGSGLVEEGRVPTSRIGITRVHLGMAGWEYPGEPPLCWQYPVGEEVIDHIGRWASASLKYLQSQLPYIEHSP